MLRLAKKIWKSNWYKFFLWNFSAFKNMKQANCHSVAKHWILKTSSSFNITSNRLSESERYNPLVGERYSLGLDRYLYGSDWTRQPPGRYNTRDPSRPDFGGTPGKFPWGDGTSPNDVSQNEFSGTSGPQNELYQEHNVPALIHTCHFASHICIVSCMKWQGSSIPGTLCVSETRSIWVQGVPEDSYGDTNKK